MTNSNINLIIENGVRKLTQKLYGAEHAFPPCADTASEEKVFVSPFLSAVITASFIACDYILFSAATENMSEQAFFLSQDFLNLITARARKFQLFHLQTDTPLSRSPRILRQTTSEILIYRKNLMANTGAFLNFEDDVTKISPEDLDETAKILKPERIIIAGGVNIEEAERIRTLFPKTEVFILARRDDGSGVSGSALRALSGLSETFLPGLWGALIPFALLACEYGVCPILFGEKLRRLPLKQAIRLTTAADYLLKSPPIKPEVLARFSFRKIFFSTEYLFRKPEEASEIIFQTSNLNAPEILAYPRDFFASVAAHNKN